MRRTLLLTNARIRPLGRPDEPIHDALLIGADGRIAGIGRAADFASLTVDRLDLAGRTVLPGFIDTHTHLAWLGRRLTTEVDLSDCDTIEVAAERAAEKARLLPDGLWLTGGGWDPTRFDRPPTHADLDRTLPDRPAALWSRDHHAVWLNRAALSQIDLTGTPPDEVERDAAGQPTGIVRETAVARVYAAIPPLDPATLRVALLAAQAHLHRHGIVATGTMEDTVIRAGLAELERSGELRLRVSAAVQVAEFDDARRAGLRTGQGSDRLRIGPVKVFADGTLGSRTAHLLEPYLDRPGSLGIPTVQSDELTDLMIRATAAGFSGAVHAIGDGAVRVALDAFEAVQRALPTVRPPMPHRIEHAQLVHSTDLPRFARLSVTAAMQAIHLPGDADAADLAWGDERCRTAYPFRSLLDSGATVVLGSDAPIATVDVPAGLAAAVARCPTGSTAPWHADQSMTRWEALRGYTTAAAGSIGFGDVLPALQIGRVADLVVLSADPLGDTDLASLRVEMTFSAGELVHDGR